MHIFCRGLVPVVLLLASGIGAAGKTPSEIELRAAYCLAVAKVQEARHEDEIKRASGSASRDTVALALKMAQERRSRLERYLEGRSASDKDSPDFKTARERGAQDTEDCDRDIKLPPYKTCSDQCMTRIRAADQQLICLTSCPPPVACQRIKTCQEKFFP
jgi:hypothetical protein